MTTGGETARTKGQPVDLHPHTKQRSGRHEAAGDLTGELYEAHVASEDRPAVRPVANGRRSGGKS